MNYIKPLKTGSIATLITAGLLLVIYDLLSGSFVAQLWNKYQWILILFLIAWLVLSYCIGLLIERKKSLF